VSTYAEKMSGEKQHQQQLAQLAEQLAQTLNKNN
jgi:hypothetical protein